jgi:hypothetical protein
MNHTSACPKVKAMRKMTLLLLVVVIIMTRQYKKKKKRRMNEPLFDIVWTFNITVQFILDGPCWSDYCYV